MGMIGRFLFDESGVTALEYGLLAALLAVLVLGVMSAAGVSLAELFTKICKTISGTDGAGC